MSPGYGLSTQMQYQKLTLSSLRINSDGDAGNNCRALPTAKNATVQIPTTVAAGTRAVWVSTVSTNSY
eukprot:504703-Rhodomonas_salina.1